MLIITNNFILGLDEIESQIKKTEKYIIEDHEYFKEQVNFFSKSIIISICSHFEAYSKEVIRYIINFYGARLNSIEVPSNLLFWDIEKDNYKEKNKDPKKDHSFSITDADIDSNISANPFRVRNAFKRCGIDFNTSVKFNDNIEILNSFVEKRNQIIHYNKGAVDLSLGDLIYYLRAFKVVINEMDKIVELRINNIL